MDPGNLLFRMSAHEGHVRFVDEAPKTEPEIGGDVLHHVDQLSGQLRQLSLVVFHRGRQVHDVIEIDWVVGSPRVREIYLELLAFPQLECHQLGLNLHRILSDAGVQLLVQINFVRSFGVDEVVGTAPVAVDV